MTLSGTNICPLVMVEIIICSATSASNGSSKGYTPANKCTVSSPLAKLQLLNLSRQHAFSRGWLRKEEFEDQSYRGLWLKEDKIHNNGDNIILSGDVIYCGKDNSECLPACDDNAISLTFLKSDDPLEERVPCIIRGYMSTNNRNINGSTSRQGNNEYHRCVVTDQTVVRVQRLLHFKQIASLKMRSYKFQNTYSNSQQSTKSYSTLSSYDPETVQSLALRMSAILSERVLIGSNTKAINSKRQAIQNCLIPMQDELNAFWESKRSELMTITPSLLREGALLVHNEYSGSGKTSLVKAVAKDILQCDAVHVLSATNLLAKYGTGADIALETTLHELALQGAIKGCSSTASKRCAKICIILDHFESFLSISTADPYSPILNAMASYLNRLSCSLRDKKEFPYPSMNSLYNFGSESGEPGLTFPLNFCLVGVITNTSEKLFLNALDALGGGRFYVPISSSKTRHEAFISAFECAGVHLDTEAREALPKIAASATWANGGAFIDIAQRLSPEHETSKRDLEEVMSSRYDASNSVVDVHTNASLPKSEEKNSSNASSVGGNFDAKLALEDALALDPKKRSLLASFGMNAPTGVILYGPPGCGKTLLAKSVAISLRGSGNNNENSFVSLKASEIVRPEVGNSEKLIVSAFGVARSNAPSVVFIDEFQAMFGDREGSSVVLGQLASTLLQCMDDVGKWCIDDKSNSSSPNGRVVVLAATNTPWMIDKAFLRPGRFDRAVHVGLPNVDDREDILRVHTKRMKLALSSEGTFQSAEEDICKSMAKLCIGFSGADLASLCKAAAVRCLQNGEKTEGVKKQHFIDAYEKDVVRSSNDDLVKRISSWAIS